jgi:glutathione S-transferase
MINAEASRCVLEYYGIGYQEVNRFLGWANILTFFRGGYGALPLFESDGLRLSGPVPIAKRFDAERGTPPLLPVEEPLHSEVQREWGRFFQKLSAAVARLAYFHLLPHKELMIKSFGEPLTKSGRTMLPVIYPAFRATLTSLLKLTPESIRERRREIDEVLDEADRRLADHQYMVGDRLTLTDIGLISASAPIFVPDHYAKWLPPIEQLPEEYAAIITEARSRPSAAYAERIYAEIAVARARWERSDSAHRVP